VNNITDPSRYSKVCARLVPQSLTNHQKTVQKETCSQVLFHYEADGDSFLSRLSLGMKHGSTILNRSQKDSQWKNNFKLLGKRIFIVAQCIFI